MVDWAWPILIRLIVDSLCRFSIFRRIFAVATQSRWLDLSFRWYSSDFDMVKKDFLNEISDARHIIVNMSCLDGSSVSLLASSLSIQGSMLGCNSLTFLGRKKCEITELVYLIYYYTQQIPNQIKKELFWKIKKKIRVIVCIENVNSNKKLESSGICSFKMVGYANVFSFYMEINLFIVHKFYLFLFACEF